MTKNRMPHNKGGEIPVLDRVQTIIFGEVEGGEHKPTFINQLLIAISVIGLFMLLIMILKFIKVQVSNRGIESPWLIKDTHNGKLPMRIIQDPNDKSDDAIPLRRSLNEHQGLEFTYLFWVFVEDFTSKKSCGGAGNWKHILHKGNPTSYPNRAPGIWFHPNTNTMRVYMNTYTNISSNYVDIPNIPINKWYHFGLIVRENALDVYINGYLKKRVVLKGIPRQNFGDVYISQNGGFDGFLSRMRYYDYAIKYSEIESHLRMGPSSKMPESMKQKPPYLTPYWWFNNPNH
jgi:hypothetical protein